MDTKDIMMMEYMDNYGSCDFEMVAIYNQSRISAAEVRKSIQSGEEHMHVIKIHKQQFDNVFKEKE